MTEPSILGLDLGTSSVGWALFKGQTLIASGTRIFPEGMDRKQGEKSLNQDRQQAKSVRRQLYRRARRKRKVEQLLVSLDLLPVQKELRELLFIKHNPYEVRALALDQKLEAYQLGRALYHLSQRRGYLSNRKTGDEKDGAVAEGIRDLRNRLLDKGCRTLGEYFFKVFDEDKIRGCYTHRQMLIDEFNVIWQAQTPYFEQLTEKNRKVLFEGIFYQRPLKMQKHLIGFCELEPERRRAYSATLQAQEFRLWQTINNLSVQLQSGAVISLSSEQKKTLHELLSTAKSRSWKAIKNNLGFLEGDHFNFEKHRPSGLLGNGTAAILCKEITPSVWHDWDQDKQEQLVFDLLNIESEKALFKRLRGKWQFSEEQSKALCDKSLGFAKGMMAYSHKAIRNLLPFLQQGKLLHEAIAEAGYKAQSEDVVQVSQLPLFDKNLRNPMVQRALYQVRRVVNAVIREYGMPDVIRVEMARDLRNNAKRRADIAKNQAQLERQNTEAASFLVEEKLLPNPTRQDKLKYRLWKECDGVCPFTGKSVSAHQLFTTAEVEVEHIIPYSRCLDDSYMNKTLCFRDANQKKGNATPYEAFSGAEYEQILQRVKKFPRKKRERFNQDVRKFTDDFVSQQLNETGYIAKETVSYLRQLGCKVEAVKGGVTAKLRHAWGLNNILSDGPQKTRDDHRHHAIDAMVVAMTSRQAVKDINTYSRRSLSGRFRLVDYPEPVSDFRGLVAEAVDCINVSHKTQHKVKGALHEDTLYGVGEVSEKRGGANGRYP